MGKRPYTNGRYSKRTFAYDGGGGTQTFAIVVRTYQLNDPLKRFISGTSDNSLQKVIFRRTTCLLWHNHVLNVFLG